MAQRNIWDAQALVAQLGGDPRDPLNTKMPVGDQPTLQEGAAAPRRGWNNLNLDAPTQRGINAFEGFNDDRALSGGDPNSAKDAMRRWLGGLDFNLQGQSKAQIGDFLKSQLGTAKDYGLDIHDVQGERVLLNTKERGPEWIDIVRGAGGDNPAFAYQADLDGVGGVTQPAPMTRTPAPSSPMGDAMPGAPPQALDQILAEVEALTQGASTPMEQEALLELLRI